MGRHRVQRRVETCLLPEMSSSSGTGARAERRQRFTSGKPGAVHAPATRLRQRRDCSVSTLLRQKPGQQKPSADKAIKDIRRATRKAYSAEEKIRIVLPLIVALIALPSLRASSATEDPPKTETGNPADFFRVGRMGKPHR